VGRLIARAMTALMGAMASALVDADDGKLSTSPADEMKAKSRQQVLAAVLPYGAAEEADGSGSSPGSVIEKGSCASADGAASPAIDSSAASAVVAADAEWAAHCSICHSGLLQVRLERCVANNRSMTCEQCDKAETACMTDARAQGQNKDMLLLKKNDYADILACATLPLFPNSLPLSVCRLRFNR
jgi:hypothetical protein